MGKLHCSFSSILRVNDFADSSIMLKILGETLPSKQGKWRAAKKIKIAFDDEGIEIPSTNSYAQTKGVEEKAIKNEQTKLKNSNRIP
jgi:small conductance mechanosensitive channel